MTLIESSPIFHYNSGSCAFIRLSLSKNSFLIPLGGDGTDLGSTQRYIPVPIVRILEAVLASYSLYILLEFLSLRSTLDSTHSQKFPSAGAKVKSLGKSKHYWSIFSNSLSVRW